MTSGLLKPAPLAIVNISELCGTVKLQFRHPISTAVENLPDPLNTSCDVSSNPGLLPRID
jgi:hypothetical protein